MRKVPYSNWHSAAATLCNMIVFSEIWHMASGTVKWFNSQKGYGFIQPTGGGRDVFVHISAVERAGLSSLNEGQRVEFEIMENRGRTSAESLRVR
jgi:cold shock protein